MEQELKELIQRRQGSQSDADTSADIDAVDIWIDLPVRPSLNKNKHTTSKRKLSRELKGWVFFIFCLLLPHRTRRTCHLIDSWRKLLTTDDEANKGGKMRSFDETERFQINNMSQPSPYNASLFPDCLGSVWPHAENTSPSYSDSLRGLLCLQIQEDIVYDSGWPRSDTTGSTPIF